MHTLKRTILITGASSGIGRAIARRLLGNEHRVVGISRDCSQFTTEDANFSSFEMDLSELDSLPEKLRKLEEIYPNLDTVIFSAGYGRFGSLEEFSYSQIQALIETNLISQMFLTKALLPGLKRNAKGDLIFIGSEAAVKGSRKGAVYCAAKFALRGFTQALREECARNHIRVSLINPGMVKTPFFSELSFYPGDDETNYLLPEDVAEAIAYILDASPSIVIDEINLNPLNKVVRFK